MNNEPSYIIINLDGVRINIMLRSGASLLTLVPKMTGSWRLAECTSPIGTEHYSFESNVSIDLIADQQMTNKIVRDIPKTFCERALC